MIENLRLNRALKEAAARETVTGTLAMVSPGPAGHH